MPTFMLGQGQYVFEGMCERSGRNEAGRSALMPDPVEAERLAALSRFALLGLARARPEVLPPEPRANEHTSREQGGPGL